jgi:hypothetical protein
MRKATRSTFKQLLCLTVIVLAAISTATVTAQQGPDRTKAPGVDSAPALKLPPIQKRTLTNGLAVSIVEMHKVPVVDITLIVRSGTAADPQGKFGLANLTADMLDEGAGSRSALELADAIDFLGASISTGSSTDSSTVRLHSTVAKLDAALPLMADVALRPAFAQTELDRVKKLRLSAFVQARDNPAAIVAAAFPRVVYGPSHRYGTGPLHVLSACQRAPVGRRRCHAGRRAAEAGKDIWLMEERNDAGAEGYASTGPTTPSASDLPCRQAGGRAIADPHRLDRCGAKHTGLLRD